MNTFLVALLAVFAVCSFAQPATDGPPDATTTMRPATDGPPDATTTMRPATDGPPDATTTVRPATDGTTTTRPNTCDVNWARYCMNTYIDNWGFNSTQTGVFPDPDTFNRAASNYINSTGLNGLTNANTWWTALQICLGPNSIPCIFDADRLQQIFRTTSTSMDGKFWLIIMLENDFINSQPAYNVARQNFQCAQRVQIQHDAQLSYCQQTYTNDINKDPVNICSYQAVFMQCLQGVYGTFCNNRLGGYVCREAGIYFFVMNPQCIGFPPTDNICYPMT